MSYNIFLDDERQPMEAVYWDHDDKSCWMIDRPLLGWKVIRSYDEFVTEITKNGLPTTVSFDHDLHPEHYTEGRVGMPPAYKRYKVPTGYQCVLWLIGYCGKLNLPLPKCYVHSFNMHGRNNIFGAIINYNKQFYAQTKKDTQDTGNANS